jgi:uncharacterized OB-fold protein
MMTDGPTSDKRLRYCRCQACGHAQAGSGPFCIRCGHAALDASLAVGGGTIVSITTVHRAPSEAFRAQVPYTLALVDADEGFRLLATVRAAPAPTIGQRVRLRLSDRGLPEAKAP